MSKGKIGDDGEIIYYEDSDEKKRERRNQIIIAIIGATATIIAGALGGVAISNYNTNNIMIQNGMTVIADSYDSTTQTAISLTASSQTDSASPSPMIILDDGGLTTPTPLPPTTLIYEENFEDGQANGLRSEDYHPWEVTTDDDGNQVYLGRPAYVLQLGDDSWDDYVFELRFKPLTFTFLEVGFRNTGTTNEGQHYLVGLDVTEGISIQRADNSTIWHSLYSDHSSALINDNGWNTLRVQVIDHLIVVTINGIQLPDTYDFELTHGGMTLAVHANTTILLDDIRVWAFDN